MGRTLTRSPVASMLSSNAGHAGSLTSANSPADRTSPTDETIQNPQPLARPRVLPHKSASGIARLGHVERSPTEATKHRIFPFCLGNLAAHYGAGTRQATRAPTRLIARIPIVRQRFLAST